jgi:4-amino-4-deoxy-L-arabinose transferase-like glycosyltransferase
MTRPSLKLLDTLVLLGLSLYALAGVAAVPVHGDESTQMFMGIDYYTQFIAGDLQSITYSDTPTDPAAQDLRLYNGSLPKYLFGLAQRLMGATPQTWQKPYDWGAPYDYNERDGRIPSGNMLVASRLASAVGLVIGIWAMFGMGWMFGGRTAGHVAAAYLALHPVILMNSRRAMMEGWLIGMSVLAVWLAVMLATRFQQHNTQNSARLSAALAVGWGVVTGLCVASKHTGIFIVGALYAALGLYSLVAAAQRRWLPLLLVALAACCGAAVFIALNPVWWQQDPLKIAGLLLERRSALLQGQVAAYGGYESLWERFAGFINFAFVAQPQYFEDARWAAPLQAAIQAYDGSWWRGLWSGELAAVMMAALSAVGVASLVRHPRSLVALWVCAWWAMAVIGLTLVGTPLPWQRYYLPVYPVIGLLVAVGVHHLWAYGTQQWNKHNSSGA